MCKGGDEMTPEQRQTLHRILLDAKAEIKDGKLYDHDGYLSSGVCLYVHFHRNGDYGFHILCRNMYEESPFCRGNDFVATPYDFSHPDRLALLDWLINETKP